MRKSDLNFYMDCSKKSIGSPLRKVGFQHKNSESLKVRKSETASFLEKEKKKKRIEQKFSLGTRS